MTLTPASAALLQILAVAGAVVLLALLVGGLGIACGHSLDERSSAVPPPRDHGGVKR